MREYRLTVDLLLSEHEDFLDLAQRVQSAISIKKSLDKTIITEGSYSDFNIVDKESGQVRYSLPGGEE